MTWVSGAAIQTPYGPFVVEDGATTFAEAVKAAARYAALSTFRVFLGDQEIESPEKAPATMHDVPEGTTVDVRPVDYDHPG